MSCFKGPLRQTAPVYTTRLHKGWIGLTSSGGLLLKWTANSSGMHSFLMHCLLISVTDMKSWCFDMMPHPRLHDSRPRLSFAMLAWPVLVSLDGTTHVQSAPGSRKQRTVLFVSAEVICNLWRTKRTGRCRSSNCDRWSYTRTPLLRSA